MSGRRWWFRYGLVGGICIWGTPLVFMGIAAWEFFNIIENQSVQMSDELAE
jgi:hypothetical protein